MMFHFMMSLFAGVAIVRHLHGQASTASVEITVLIPHSANDIVASLQHGLTRIKLEVSALLRGAGWRSHEEVVKMCVTTSLQQLHGSRPVADRPFRQKHAPEPAGSNPEIEGQDGYDGGGVLEGPEVVVVSHGEGCAEKSILTTVLQR